MLFKSLSVAAAALALTATTALASVTPVQTLTFGPTITDFSNAQAFSLFDPALGTLTGVTVSAGFGFNSTLSLTNNASSASSGSVRTEAFLKLSAAGNIGGIINGANLLGAQTAGAPPSLGSYVFDSLGSANNYSANPGQTITGIASNARTQTLGAFTDTAAADIANFIGTGTSSLTAATFTQTVLSNNGGNSSATQVTNATATFSIFYTYNPTVTPPVNTPEPASALLLASGLAGAGVLRARRK